MSTSLATAVVSLPASPFPPLAVGFAGLGTGVYLFAGLTLFGTFKTPALYMAALAFTAYGVHWFAIGWNRLRRADPPGCAPTCLGLAGSVSVCLGSSISAPGCG